MDSRKPIFNPGVTYTVIDENGLIITHEPGEIHITDKVGATILPYFDGKHSVSELAEIVLEQFDIEKEIVLKDIQEFLLDLRNKQVISYAS